MNVKSNGVWITYKVLVQMVALHALCTVYILILVEKLAIKCFITIVLGLSMGGGGW